MTRCAAPRSKAANARIAELTAAIEAVATIEPPEAEDAVPSGAGDSTPIRFVMGADDGDGDANVVTAADRSWSRAGMLLLAVALVVAVGMLMLTGYGAYCSGNPCG